MTKKQEKTPSANFVVFRTLESLVFAVPICVAFFYEVPVFLVTIVICGTMYGLWTRFFKSRRSRDDIKAYEAVYDEGNKTEAYRLSELNPPWTMWLVWIAVIIWAIAFM